MTATGIPEGLGPDHVLHWTPERADVRAFASLPGELRGWRFWGLIVTVAGFGAAKAGLEPWLPWLGSAWLILPFAAAGYLVWVAVLSVVATLKVRRWPLPAGELRLRVEPDRLVLMTDAGEEAIGFAEIGNVIVTSGHVFIQRRPGEAVIVPARAFASAPDMAAFGSWIDEASLAVAA